MEQSGKVWAWEPTGPFGEWDYVGPDEDAEGNPIKREPVATVIYGGTEQVIRGPILMGGQYRYEPDEAARIGLAAILLWLELINGAYVITEVQAKAPPGQRLDLESLRRVNFSTAVPRITRIGLHFFSFPHESDQWGYEEMLRQTRQDQSIEPTKAERAAFYYTVARLLGEHPNKAVAEALGISVDAAMQRVRRARQAGLLLPLVSEQKADV